ncbi:MAG: aminotransferase class V-fold PLP-dependent enzyme [Planctomycetes bacterium]|nr:aminotransferase class V-fold PLP-dependent enzyme [Planctomycetota bacterium]
MIYLDHAATSPPGGELAELFRDCFSRYAFNSGASYEPGLKAREALEETRNVVAKGLCVDAGGLIFTSGGTEANNTAIHSAASKASGKVAWLSATAHPSQREPLRRLAEDGVLECQILPVGPGGRVDLAAAASLSAPALVVAEWVNNELGFIQPIRELAALAKGLNPRALVLIDGVQGFGKLPVPELGDIDAFTLSGHKLGAPAGIGALYVSSAMPKRPLLSGGGQEGGWRSGTLPVPLIRCFHCAYERSKASVAPALREIASRAELRPLLKEEGEVSPCILTLDTSPVEGEVLMHRLEGEGVIVGLGSACSAASRKPSAVHAAAGIGAQRSRCSVRLSVAPGQAESEVIEAVGKIAQCLEELRRFFK